ncbi:MAG: sugar transferase [Bacteroidales bacterium]|nr:sugar transferase [Bacteroidales bacterium]
MPSPKIIIVDDDNHILQFFSEVLSNAGYDIVGKFYTGKETITFLESNDADLVLMDIGLKSELNGIESSKIIKEKYGIPIVFITGNTSKDVYNEAKTVKPSGYIIKPVNSEDLKRTVDISLNNFEKIPNRDIKKNLQIKNIVQEVGERGYQFFADYISCYNKNNLVISTTTRFNIINQQEDQYKVIVNLKKINSAQRINKFLEAVNFKLAEGGIFIGHAETKGLRKKMILKKYPWGLNYIAYFMFFLLKRVWPKIPLLNQIYFYITKGRNRAISRAEVLGRLISCGFEIIKEEFIDANLHFIVKKTREPYFDMNASYDLIFKMKRIGKNGKTIYVYKFRTMHPYSEYIQDYILQKHGYAENGKPANDFRLTTWGRFMRRYWLDELPQLINVFKGEMKLVGVRPISQRFLDEYPEDVRQMRLKYKPGCVPPYVALLKQDVAEYIESERTYLLEKQKKPYTTDLKYFFKAIYNIITNKIRSA